MSWFINPRQRFWLSCEISSLNINTRWDHPDRMDQTLKTFPNLITRNSFSSLFHALQLSRSHRLCTVSTFLYTIFPPIPSTIFRCSSLANSPAIWPLASVWPHAPIPLNPVRSETCPKTIVDMHTSARTQLSFNNLIQSIVSTDRYPQFWC